MAGKVRPAGLVRLTRVQRAESAAMARARVVGRPVVVGAETTPTVEVEAHPDGLLSMMSNVFPVRVKVHGVWRAINPDLRQTAGGSWAVLGQQTEQIQYTSAPTVTGSVVMGGGPQVTATSYDASGNKSQIKDPAGNIWSYSYDLMNRQVKEVSPDAGSLVTGYDAAGNVAYTTNGAGVTVNYSFDGLNRKIAEHSGSTTQGSGTLIASWIWDTLKKGKLSSESSVVGGATYKTGMLGYDSSGNVSGTYVIVPTGQPLAGTYRTQYSYSTTGLMLTENPAAGGGLPVDALALKYDQFGNPNYENGFDVYVNNATWTPYNEISQIDLGSGPSSAALTYSYDPRTRNVTGINLSDQQPVPQVDNIAYHYSADQQVTRMTDTQGGGAGAPVEDQCFNYDSLSHLSGAWTSTNACATDPATAGNGTVNGPEPYWQSWTFDPEGDILTATSNASAGSTAGDTTTTYHYGVSGHAHAVSSTSGTNTVTGSLGSVSYGYDGAGDTTTLGNQTLTWDAVGKLSTAGTSAAPASYVYTADGDEIMESDTSGGTTTTTLYLPGEQISTNGTTMTGVRYYTFAGHQIAETTPATLYWLTGTDQGSMTTAVAAFSESSLAIRRVMTPYGTPLPGGGTWPDDHSFLGAPAHPATGLVDVGARKYDPATGLFLSVDPVLSTTNPQAMTGYTYAADSPITNEDPSGEMFVGGGGGFSIGSCPYGSPGCPGYHAPAPVYSYYSPMLMGHLGLDPYIAYLPVYHPPVVRPRPKPAVPPYIPFGCGHLGVDCSPQGSATSAGIGPVSVTDTHGNLSGNDSQDWGTEPGVGAGPADFNVEFGFSQTWGYSWQMHAGSGPSINTQKGYACMHLSEC